MSAMNRKNQSLNFLLTWHIQTDATTLIDREIGQTFSETVLLRVHFEISQLSVLVKKALASAIKTDFNFLFTNFENFTPSDDNPASFHQ
jgi:hypothetical protein